MVLDSKIYVPNVVAGNKGAFVRRLLNLSFPISTGSYLLDSGAGSRVYTQAVEERPWS